MKKALCVFLTVVVLLCLTSCGSSSTLNGKYVCKNDLYWNGWSYAFNGENYTLTSGDTGNQWLGTYEIFDDKIMLHGEYFVSDYGTSRYVTNETKTFEKGPGYICIDGTKYSKK